MILQQILADLETSVHPVAKALHKGTNFKVLAIGFKKGMILKEHQAHLPTQLFVLSGKVIYKQGDASKTFSALEQTEIPVEITHSVEALEDSMCLLTQG